MANIPEYRAIFDHVLNALEYDDLSRRELIDSVIDGFALSPEEIADKAMGSHYSNLRSSAGIVINDMLAKGVIGEDDSGRYRKTEERIIAIRIDECENEIVRLVSERPMTKSDIKSALVRFFKTDTTPTLKDDNHLFTYTGQILKTLIKNGTFELNGSTYSIAPDKSAYIKDRSEMLELRRAFLARVHSRGGEFFEIYFLNLINRYLSRMGKSIIESYVSGGSDDGGIDGVIRTRDCLGFCETVMIQTKNRKDIISETDVRSFYGAVCAKRGSRGIFATISDFHPMAKKLLDSLDDCVGVDGERIFSMACETGYGIKREGDKLTLDKEII